MADDGEGVTVSFRGHQFWRSDATKPWWCVHCNATTETFDDALVARCGRP